ncbi:MAG: DMT family transporter, partial [Alphaproteobacteria bacterium]|nr:DMT family transporter [Alphaproteobacteria bacterium]
MNALRERWLALAPNVRGALWLLAACLVFSIMGALIKLLGTHLPSHQSAFFRALFGNLAVLPFALHLGRAGFATKRLPLHLSRGLTGAGAMLCGFYATVHLPLAESVALSFTKPLWLIPLAVLILGEPVRARRWTATAVGFVGVLVMLRPGGASIDPAVGVALLGALLVALVNIQVKKLVSTEAPATLVFY